MKHAPVCIENDSSVTTEKGDTVRQFASLFNGNDCKSTATRGIPVDGDVLGIDLYESFKISELGEGTSSGRGMERAQSTHLHEIGIPSILRDAKVIVALVL